MHGAVMDHDRVAKFFTRSDGSYLFARWGRPIVPVVFGVDDATLAVVKGAIEAVVFVAGHKMAETDPELGANLLVFFVADWDELSAVPDISRMIPDFDALLERLRTERANQYRAFRFDDTGAIKAAFVFINISNGLEDVPAEDLALAQAAQIMLLWSDVAFRENRPLAEIGGRVLLNPDVAEIIRAGYDPVMPAVSDDASHALRLAARMGSGAPN